MTAKSLEAVIYFTAHLAINMSCDANKTGPACRLALRFTAPRPALCDPVAAKQTPQVALSLGRPEPAHQRRRREQLSLEAGHTCRPAGSWHKSSHLGQVVGRGQPSPSPMPSAIPSPIHEGIPPPRFRDCRDTVSGGSRPQEEDQPLTRGAGGSGAGGAPGGEPDNSTSSDSDERNDSMDAMRYRLDLYACAARYR